MAQQIDIPGLGIVEFPDGMSDDDIASAIKKNIMPTLPATSTASSVGRTVAGFADTILGAPGALANQIGYAGARAMGKSPEQAKKAEIFETQPLAKAFGVGQSPEYRSEATQRLGAFVGENVGKGAEWISKQTGVPVADVENMINTLGMGAGVKTAPLANKAIGVAGAATEKAVVGTGKAVANAGRNVAAAPGKIAQGAANAFKSPNAPVASRVIPETIMKDMRSSGDIGPISEAVIRANSKEVPIYNRGMEAAAESAVRGYTGIGRDTKSTIFGGVQGAADLATIIGTGLPLPLGSMARGALSAVGSRLSPILSSEGGPSGMLNFGSRNPNVGNYSSHPIHDIMMSAGEALGSRATPELVNQLVVSNRAKQLMTEAKNKNIEMPKDMATQIAEQEFKDFQTLTKQSRPAEPAKPEALAITNNPSPIEPKPMYASESGIIGNDMNAVTAENLNRKYAPQAGQKQSAGPAPLMITNNPTQKPMYASQNGVVGNDMNAVMAEDFNRKYAPQPVGGGPVQLPASNVVSQPLAPSAPVTPVAKEVLAPSAPKTTKKRDKSANDELVKNLAAKHLSNFPDVELPKGITDTSVIEKLKGLTNDDIKIAQVIDKQNFDKTMSILEKAKTNSLSADDKKILTSNINRIKKMRVNLQAFDIVEEIASEFGGRKKVKENAKNGMPLTQEQSLANGEKLIKLAKERGITPDSGYQATGHDYGYDQRALDFIKENRPNDLIKKYGEVSDATARQYNEDKNYMANTLTLSGFIERALDK
jgi:hypothetical protein